MELKKNPICASKYSWFVFMSYLEFCVILQICFSLFNCPFYMFWHLIVKARKRDFFSIFTGSDLSYFRTNVLNINITRRSCFHANRYKWLSVETWSVFFPKLSLNHQQMQVLFLLSAVSVLLECTVQPGRRGTDVGNQIDFQRWTK